MPIKRIKDFADGGSDISSDDVFLLWMILSTGATKKLLSDLDSAIGGTAYTAGSGLTLVGTEFNANLVSNTGVVPNSVKVTNVVMITLTNYNNLAVSSGGPGYDANTLYFIIN